MTFFLSKALSRQGFRQRNHDFLALTPQSVWVTSHTEQDVQCCFSESKQRTTFWLYSSISVVSRNHLSYRKNRILRLFLIFWHSLILHYIHFTQRYLSAKKKETSCVIQYTVVWNKNSHQATSCVKRTVLYWFDCLCLFSLINSVFKCSLSINTC